MACRDCVHYELCKIWCGEANIPMSTDCDYFKNKADVVEVKHGQWTYKEIFGIEFPECSVCGTQFEDANCGDYPYCPECGAKMDGERKCENENPN